MALLRLWLAPVLLAATTKPVSRRVHIRKYTENFLASTNAAPSAAGPPAVRTANCPLNLGGGGPQPPFDDEEQRKQQEFRLNVGKVIDAVQADYPVIFEVPPDFSIYEANIELTDPSGVSLRGLKIYRQCFVFLRLMRRTLSSVEMKSKVSYSLWDPYTVRVRWNIALSTLLNPGRTYFIDGVSKYSLNERGFVRRHELSNVIVNGREVQQDYLQILPLRMAHHGVATAAHCATPSIFRHAGRATSRGASDKRAPPPHPVSQSNVQFCEDSYDCDYPLFCCDLLLAKVCCSNGAFAPVPQPIPIPIPVDPPYPGMVDDQMA